MVTIISKDFHVQDPHLVFLNMFTPDEETPLTVGSRREFIVKTNFFMFCLYILRCIFTAYVPTIIDIILIIGLNYLMMSWILFMFKLINMSIRKAKIFRMAKILLLMMGTILILGI